MAPQKNSLLPLQHSTSTSVDSLAIPGTSIQELNWPYPYLESRDRVRTIYLVSPRQHWSSSTPSSSHKPTNPSLQGSCKPSHTAIQLQEKLQPGPRPQTASWVRFWFLFALSLRGTTSLNRRALSSCSRSKAHPQDHRRRPNTSSEGPNWARQGGRCWILGWCGKRVHPSIHWWMNRPLRTTPPYWWIWGWGCCTWCTSTEDLKVPIGTVWCKRLRVRVYGSKLSFQLH